MQFQIKRDILLKSLAAAHNVIEEKKYPPYPFQCLIRDKK